MKTSYLLEINELAQRFKPSVSQLSPPPHDNIIEPGQIWSTRAKPIFPKKLPKLCKIDDPYFIVIVRRDKEIKGHSTYVVAPILRNYLMAGPHDVILPEEILCHRITVSLELSITILQDSLDECIGTLPAEWAVKLGNYLHYIEGLTDKKPAIYTGIEYLDENDVNYQCHKTMIKELEYLQAPVIAWAKECKVLVQNVSLAERVYKNIKKSVKSLLSDIQSIIDQISDWIILPTELLPKWALARAEGGEFPRLDATYELTEENAVLHFFVAKDLKEGSNICLIKIFDRQGKLSEVLDDAAVVGKHGDYSVPIKGGQTEITLKMVQDGFVVLRSDNTQVKMQKL